MRRIVTSAAFALALLLGPSAYADSRDDWLMALSQRAEALKSMDTDQVDRFREAAVILAEELNRFTVEETEIRKDDKVPPPDIAIRRPGDEVGNEKDKPDTTNVGSAVPLAEVPNTWFNLYITDANQRLTELIRLIEQTKVDTFQSFEIHAHAVAVDRALDLLVRPPEE